MSYKNSVYAGNNMFWEDLRVAPNVRGTGSQNPAFEVYLTNGAGSRGVWAYSFTNANAGSEKEIFFMMQMPHAWAANAVHMHLHWVPATTENNTSVSWGLEYTWVEPGAVFGNTTIIYAHATAVPANAVNLVANTHYITEFADITPTTTSDGLSTVMWARLFRDSSDATYDTYTDKVGLLFIDVHYQSNALGSHQELVKL